LLVTTRHMPQSSTSCRVLAQVTTPRDPLPGPSHRNNRAMRFVHLPVPQRASFDLALNPRTPEPWVMARLEGSNSNRKRPRRQCHVSGRQAAKTTTQTGVVSRVPRSARPAQAGETDRDTNRTCGTHQGQLNNERRGRDERPELRTEATLPAQPRRQLFHAVRARAHSDHDRQPTARDGLPSHAGGEPEAQARGGAGRALEGGIALRRHEQEPDDRVALVGRESGQAKCARPGQRLLRHPAPE